MLHLLSLPAEILSRISYCLSDTDHASILRLHLVNKLLHEITTPLLARRWPANFTGDPDALSPGIHQFALVLLRQPELRRRIQELGLAYLEPIDQFDRNHDTSKLSPADLEALAEAARQSWPSLAETTDWVEQVRLGIPDALAALVLSWAVNITKLDITVPCFPIYRADTESFMTLQWVAQAVRRINSQVPGPVPLANLRWVSYRHWDTECGTPMKGAAPFFHLPEVKTFHAYRLHEAPWDDEEDEYLVDGNVNIPPLAEKYIVDFPQGSSSVEELILEDADISTSGLLTLVRACRSLKLLNLRYGPILDNNQIDHREFSQVIAHHGDSLLSLIFDMGEDQGLDWSHPPPMGSSLFDDCFQRLHCLIHLRLAIGHLYADGPTGDDDIFTKELPPSLETLELGSFLSECWHHTHHDTLKERYCRDMRLLLQDCGPQGRYPNMKKLDLVTVLADDPDLPIIAEMKNIAAAAGVELLLGRLPSPRPPISL